MLFKSKPACQKCTCKNEREKLQVGTCSIESTRAGYFCPDINALAKANVSQSGSNYFQFFVRTALTQLLTHSLQKMMKSSKSFS